MTTDNGIVAQMYARGFCVIEQAYPTDECDRLRELLDAHWRAAGRPPLTGRGFGIHPLLNRVPGVAPFLGNARVVDTLSAILADGVRLARTGARITDESSGPSLVNWHNHYSWNSKQLPHRERVERVIALVYPDGTGDDVGNLAVIPRRFDAPLQPIDRDAPSLPDEVVVRVSPGSVVIIDSALWHCARRGRRMGRRHLLGGQYQGWRNDRSHPDDRAVDIAEIAELKQGNAILRRLVEGPPVPAGGGRDGTPC